MGVKGLTSFVEQQPDLLWEYQLYDTRVIVDGYGCMFYLYSDHMDHGHHGGEYEAYEERCRLFFTNLRKCNISPFVVFDGAYDLDDKKLSTSRERCQERIRFAGNIADGRSGYLLPVLSDHVFRKVLKDLDIPFVVCDFEADHEIAALANAWNCSVLGRDSDFFIMDIKAGYLSLEMLDWNHVRKKSYHGGKSKGRSAAADRRVPQTINYLSAGKYTLSKFCKFFNVKKELIPLLATVTGNDYLDPICINQFLCQVYQRPKKGKNTAKKHGHLYSVLDWLADQEEMEDCLQKILRCLKMDQRSKVRSALETSLKMYLPSDDSNLARYFAEKFVSSSQNFSGARIAIAPWCHAAFRHGDMPSTIINVMCTQRIFTMTQVENHAMPTSNDTSRWIRQIIYGMLLRHTAENPPPSTGLTSSALKDASVKKKEPKKPHLKVIEYDRKGRSLKCNEVEPVYDVANFGKVLKFSDLPHCEEATRCMLLLAALQVDTTGCNAIPIGFHLPAFVVIYWLSHADPKANPHHLRALLLCWVRSIAKQKHRAICRGAASVQHNPAAHTLMEWDNSEVQAVMNNFHVNVDPKMKSYALDVEACHGFAQWQSCLKATFHLNAALLRPFQVPDVTMLYSGKLVHCLYGIMKGIPGVNGHQAWLEQNLFRRAPAALALYNALHGFITSHIPSDALFVPPPRKRRRRGGRSRRGRSRPRPGYHHDDEDQEVGEDGNWAVCNQFTGLVLEGDDEDC